MLAHKLRALRKSALEGISTDLITLHSKNWAHSAMLCNGRTVLQGDRKEELREIERKIEKMRTEEKNEANKH